jgi:hypothetical protein
MARIATVGDIRAVRYHALSLDHPGFPDAPHLPADAYLYRQAFSFQSKLNNHHGLAGKEAAYGFCSSG